MNADFTKKDIDLSKVNEPAPVRTGAKPKGPGITLDLSRRHQGTRVHIPRPDVTPQERKRKSNLERIEELERQEHARLKPLIDKELAEVKPQLEEALKPLLKEREQVRKKLQEHGKSLAGYRDELDKLGIELAALEDRTLSRLSAGQRPESQTSEAAMIRLNQEQVIKWIRAIETDLVPKAKAEISEIESRMEDVFAEVLGNHAAQKVARIKAAILDMHGEIEAWAWSVSGAAALFGLKGRQASKSIGVSYDLAMRLIG